MDTDAAARIFGELGNRTRLDILLLLIKSGPDGLSIGDIQAHLDIPLSTLSFHLRGLAGARLIEQEKQGRTVMCRPSFATLAEAVTYLKRECCVGVGTPRARRTTAA
jgi:DNA-binding transcriptional ArsR family regulator